MQRLELLRQLRSGDIDVIVGVNLLREAGFFGTASHHLVFYSFAAGNLIVLAWALERKAFSIKGRV